MNLAIELVCFGLMLSAGYFRPKMKNAKAIRVSKIIGYLSGVTIVLYSFYSVLSEKAFQIDSTASFFLLFFSVFMITDKRLKVSRATAWKISFAYLGIFCLTILSQILFLMFQ